MQSMQTGSMKISVGSSLSIASHKIQEIISFLEEEKAWARVIGAVEKAESVWQHVTKAVFSR